MESRITEKDENMYKDILCEDFVEEYKLYHMTLFKELNIMLFDVAFLKECVLQNRRMIDSDIIVLYLFRNIFEHLVLKTYRIMFDAGVDVLTLDVFVGKVIKNLKSDDLENDVRNKMSATAWKSDHIKVVKKRLKESLREFRNKAIAHKLTQEMKDLSVNLEDISELLDAAIELFEIFSFYPLDFYDHKISEHSFIAEQLTVQEESKQLLDLLWLSSKDIRKIDIKLRNSMSKSDKEKIENFVSQYNLEREEDAICSKLFMESEIKAFTRVDLLQINEFKKELLKHKKISDAEILNIVCKLRQQFANDKSKDKVIGYKLSIMDTCIENIKKTINKNQ